MAVQVVFDYKTHTHCCSLLFLSHFSISLIICLWQTMNKCMMSQTLFEMLPVKLSTQRVWRRRWRLPVMIFMSCGWRIAAFFVSADDALSFSQTEWMLCVDLSVCVGKYLTSIYFECVWKPSLEHSRPFKTLSPSLTWWWDVKMFLTLKLMCLPGFGSNSQPLNFRSDVILITHFPTLLYSPRPIIIIGLNKTLIVQSHGQLTALHYLNYLFFW